MGQAVGGFSAGCEDENGGNERRSTLAQCNTFEHGDAIRMY